MTASTTAKLKHDIDRGRTGDKVDATDPAAAPLGTDEEAAGTPPSRHAIKQAHEHEVGSGPSSERRASDQGVTIYLAIVAAVISTVGTAIWLSRVG